MKIELKKITKRFKDNIVLDNVDIEFNSGKIYGFTGRNGSGKTVLMKIICGFFKPSSGIVLFDKKDINKDFEFPPATRVLIESPQFIPMMTGYQNLKLLADIQGKISQIQIVETLKKVNLYESKDKLYHKYSLGMKQKLGIAQVLMEDPTVIILDEPFNGIEKESVEKIKQLLIEEKDKGKIILISSHIKEDIDFLSDEIFYVDSGKVTKIK